MKIFLLSKVKTELCLAHSLQTLWTALQPLLGSTRSWKHFSLPLNTVQDPGSASPSRSTMKMFFLYSWILPHKIQATNITIIEIINNGVINIVYWNYITIVNKNIFSQSWSCVIWYLKKKDCLLGEWFDFADLIICIWFDYAIFLKLIAHDLIMQLEKVWSDLSIYVPREKIKFWKKKTTKKKSF